MTRPFPSSSDGDWIPSYASILGWVVRHHRLLLVSALLGTAGGVVVAMLRPTYYMATTTWLISSGASGDLAQLRGLASQFGVSGALGAGKDEFPPELVAQLVRSPYILLPIVKESLFVEAADVPKGTLLDLLDAKPRGFTGASEGDRRAFDAVRRLAKLLTTGVDRKTRAITITARMRWPQVSTAVVQRLAIALDSVVFESSRQRARSERRAMAELIDQQQERLRGAEAALIAFVDRNRTYAQSPDLTFQYERLQRDVSLHQQVLTSLTQAREQAQVRETQIAPSLTIIEPPTPPVLPEPRRRAAIVLAGLLAGIGLGVARIRWSERLQVG